MPLPSGTTSCIATDVNEVGMVVGYAYNPGQPVAVAWTPGPGGHTATVLPPDGSNIPTEAYGCNDRGDVVGRTTLGHPFAWNAVDGTTDLFVHGLGAQLKDVNESRVGTASSVRFDLNDGSIQNLGTPTGTGSTYGWVEFSCMNDAGTVGGYAHTATSLPDAFEAIRYHDQQGWTAFNSPIPQANALAIDAADDTLFQLFFDSSAYLYVDGVGSTLLESRIDPSTPGWDLAAGGVMSRSGRIAVLATNTITGGSGVVVLTRLPFVDLGGSTPGVTGRPVLRGDGSLAGGGAVELRLLNARPASTALLFASLSPSPVPFLGGTLFTVPPAVQILFTTNSQGRITLLVSWPAVPTGTQFVLQFAIADASAPHGAVLSNALSGITP